MKLTCDSDQLARAATFAARHATDRGGIPALSGLRLSASSRAGSGQAGGDRTDTMSLTGYDYEACSTATAPARVDEPGEFLLPGRVFAEIARGLPADETVMRSEGSRVEIVSAGIDFTVPTSSLVDYPELPGEPSPIGSVDTRELARAADHLMRIAPRDQVVPVLTGTCLEFGPEQLTLMASDRYRIEIHELPWLPSTGDLPGTALVPARLLTEAAKGLDREGSARLGFDGDGDAVLGLSDESRGTTMRLLDDRYPPLRSKIPETFTGVVTLRVDDLRAALRRLCVVADRFAAVLLHIDRDGVGVEANGDGDIRGRQRLAGHLDGSGVTLGFNASYLLDGLEALDLPWVRLAFQEGIRPALMSGAAAPDEVPDRPRVRYVALPRRITS